MIHLKNETTIENVPAACKELFPEIIEAYKSEFSDSIQEIRLLGSVPRGDLIPRVSDIDFLCILKGNTTYEKPIKFGDVESQLLIKFPLVQNFDLDITNERFIERNFDYKLLIMTDSISIYGSNLYWTESYEISAEELASLWNPDSNELIAEYSDQIFQSDDPVLINSTTKLIGKDILKSYRPILMKKYNCFNRSIEKTTKQLIKNIPEFSELFELLFKLYSNPKSIKNIKKEIRRIKLLNQKLWEQFET
jgi:predicted nucleotidyltransferase